MSTQIILLERVEKLGSMGDIVNVKPGYARNYLLPQKKAMRASKANIAYFEAQKKHLQADSDNKKTEAEKLAKKLSTIKVPLIRQASESGHLYGSVTSRDIAAGIAEVSKEAIVNTMIDVNQNFKSIGLFPVDVILHPEVKVAVTVNIARSPEEADLQEKSGRALISDGSVQDEPEDAQDAATDEALEDVLEDSALEAEKDKKADAEIKAVEDAEKAEKSAAKAEVKKAKKEAEAAEAEGEEAATELTA